MANALTYQSEFTGQQMDERFTAVATLTAALEALTGVVAQKYVKPSDGIPSTDMTAAVQASLAKAESAVQSLADYYTKTEVDQLLAAINGMDYVDVSTLPTASASTMGKIYLLGPDSSGYYAYYYTSYDGTSYSWVGPLGTTEISLSNYATKAELNQLDQKVGDIDYVNIHYGVDDVTWETGGVKGSDGSNRTTSSSMKRTDYIDVGGLKTITFMGTQSNTAGETYGYAFYDSSKTYVSGSRWDEDLQAPAEIKKVYTVAVPATAKYFRTCRYVPIVGNDWYLDSQSGETVADSLESLDTRVTALESEIQDVVSDSVFSPGILNTFKSDFAGWYECQETEFAEDFKTWNEDANQYPPTYANLLALYDGFVSANPGRMTKYDLGAASGTDAGGNTYHLYEYRIVPKIATHTINKRVTPRILLDAAMHGTERNCAFGLYYFVKDLLYNYDKNPILNYLRTYVEIRFIPITNPWGFEHNKYVNANGVNINRNFPTDGWTPVPTPSDQATGAEPLDQPEAAILNTWLTANKGEMLIHLNLHTNGARTAETNFANSNCLMPISTCSDAFFNRVYPAIQRHIQYQTEKFPEEYDNITLGYNDIIGRYQTDSNYPGTVDEYAVKTLNVVSMTEEVFGGMKNGSNETVVVGGSSQSQKMCAEMIGNFVARILQEYSL